MYKANTASESFEGLSLISCLESIEDPRFGRIFARYSSWGFDREQFRELETHQCTDEELGFSANQQNSRFYPIHEKNIHDVQIYKKKLYCIDEKLQL